MYVRLAFSLFFIFSFTLTSQSQQASQDTSKKTVDINEVVITATRTEQKSDRIPAPVTVIQAAEIKAAGFVKLSEVVGELNGASVMNYFGNGLQLRGLDPAYTLILIDNEPVIGRNGGTYDLDKIPVSNIERIEVVRGPVSALYGSEALAGVINIITKKPQPGITGDTKLSYGSNSTTDISGTVGYKGEKISSQLYADGFRTLGYDLDKATLYSSGGKNTNGTLQGKMGYYLNDKIALSLNSRYYHEVVTNRDRFADASGVQDFDMSDKTGEFSVTPGAKMFWNNATLAFNNHFSLYDYHSLIEYVTNGQLYLDDIFKQTLYKPELIFDKRFNENYLLTSGAGYVGEKISTNRYQEDKFQSTLFFFLQAQATLLKKVILIGGARIDHSSVYENHLSPKISAQYAPFKKVRLIASWGTGFKSPDFRQLYLNFNNAAIGYSVFGSEELASELELLQQAGQIESILVNQNELGKLNPESSNSFDAIVEYKPSPKVSVSVNGFRNDINDLIETKAVAQKFNGQYVYSYLNLNRVYTQGVQADVKYELGRNFSAAAGYQYLEAKDKQIVEDLKEGKIFARDPETLFSYKVKSADYGGLFNRSKHSGNVKLNYRNERYKFGASLRYVYRGRYGFADQNGNSILDVENEYVDGYGLLNLSLSKELTKMVSVQATANNLLGYTNAKYIPSIAGRIFLVTININFIKNQNQTTNNEKL